MFLFCASFFHLFYFLLIFVIFNQKSLFVKKANLILVHLVFLMKEAINMNKSYTNSLINEKSPYLLQHAHNPVNWFAWNKTAFDKARIENKPIFLSIGYSTCHWCHVMAHESFENLEIANYLNEHFISIKVDREEHPEIDNIYMQACQAMNGNGGWPLTVFINYQQKPFFVNTYFPPEDRYGRIGFLTLLKRINEIWQNDYEKIDLSINTINSNLINFASEGEKAVLNKDLIHKAFSDFFNSFDTNKGGFNKAPKFPSPHNLLFLLNYFLIYNQPEALNMVEKTLIEMRKGGIFDHIGYGFHRYSTDENWLVPHFEKMLYDQAMLILAYSNAFSITKNDTYKNTVLQITEYLKRELLNNEGGFYSAQDADSEGEEGKFYLWNYTELNDILNFNQLVTFIKGFNIQKEGNYLDESRHVKTGNNIPFITDLKTLENPEIEKIRSILFSIRKERIPPLTDTKILTDWNGLTIKALAYAGTVLDDKELTNLAINNYTFVKKYLINKDYTLKHRYIDGESGLDSTADDYAFLIWGLLELYKAELNSEYLIDSIKLTEKLVELFWNEKNYGLFFAPNNGEKLFNRSKQTFDNAIPAANSIAVSILNTLFLITSNTKYEEYKLKLLSSYGIEIENFPRSFSMLLNSYQESISFNTEIVIFENNQPEKAKTFLELIKQNYISNYTLLYINYDNFDIIGKYAPFIKSFNLSDTAKVYICKNHSCELPIDTIDALEKALEELV